MNFDTRLKIECKLSKVEKRTHKDTFVFCSHTKWISVGLNKPYITKN